MKRILLRYYVGAADRHDVAHERPAAYAGDVHGLRSVVAGGQVEVDVLALAQRLVVAVGGPDAGVVHEDVLALVRAVAHRAEPVPQAVVEPLDLPRVLADHVAVHDLVHHRILGAVFIGIEDTHIVVDKNLFDIVDIIIIGGHHHRRHRVI